MIANGFKISIGWKRGKNGRSSHLLEPLTSMPRKGTSNKAKKDTANKIQDIFIKFLLLIMENVIIKIIPIKIYIRCLKKK